MSSYHLNISTPDGARFDGQAEQLLFRAAGGDMAILRGHVSMMTTIRPGRIKVTLPDGAEKTGHAESGIVTVSRAGVTLLSDTFKWTE